MDRISFKLQLLAVILTLAFATVTGCTLDNQSKEAEPTSVSQNAVSWQEAAQYYGDYKTVIGRIVTTHNSGKACFLNFHPDYRNHFTAVIFRSDYSLFPRAPETYYRGKSVRVSGLIKKYRGKPEIILNSPSQIEIVD